MFKAQIKPSIPSGPSPSVLSATKDVGLVTWRFTQTLLKRLPDVADGNPVKVAFGIAKLILDIKDVSPPRLGWHAIDDAVRAYKEILMQSGNGLSK